VGEGWFIGFVWWLVGERKRMWFGYIKIRPAFPLAQQLFEFHIKKLKLAILQMFFMLVKLLKHKFQ
jgi:hypothetical protein